METLKGTLIQNNTNTIIDKEIGEIVIRDRYRVEFSFKIRLKVEVMADT